MIMRTTCLVCGAFSKYKRQYLLNIIVHLFTSLCYFFVSNFSVNHIMLSSCNWCTITSIISSTFSSFVTIITIISPRLSCYSRITCCFTAISPAEKPDANSCSESQGALPLSHLMIIFLFQRHFA